MRDATRDEGGLMALMETMNEKIEKAAMYRLLHRHHLRGRNGNGRHAVLPFCRRVQVDMTVVDGMWS